MPTYRIFQPKGAVKGSARVIFCADDVIAVDVARQLLDGHALEIWDDAKMLERLEPKGPP